MPRLGPATNKRAVRPMPNTDGRPLLERAVGIAEKRGLMTCSQKWFEVCDFGLIQLIYSHQDGQARGLKRLDDMLESLILPPEGRPSKEDIARDETLQAVRNAIHALIAEPELPEPGPPDDATFRLR